MKIFARILIITAVAIISVPFVKASPADIFRDTHYQVDVLDGKGNVVETSTFKATVKYSTYTIPLNYDETSAAFRISLVGGSYGGIDNLSLQGSSCSVLPVKAYYTDSSRDITYKVLSADLNVATGSESPIVVEFGETSDCMGPYTLSVNANSYYTSDKYAMNAPSNGDMHYNYSFTNNPGIDTSVDGIISEVDGIAEPDFTDNWIPGTGHPEGNAYFYLRDDTEYLYVSSDITPDNTEEYGTDWFQLTVVNPSDSNPALFRVSDLDDTYGKCDFGYTSKVSYEHQTCELAIPKSLLPEANLEFRVQYYGTLGEYSPALLDIYPLDDDFGWNFITTEEGVVEGEILDLGSGVSHIYYSFDPDSYYSGECSIEDPIYFGCNFSYSSSEAPLEVGDTETIYLSACDAGDRCAEGDDRASISFTVEAPEIQLSELDPADESTITDNTPLISFATNINATCRASLEDESYDNMADDIACTGSDTTSHTCLISDLGVDGEKNIYISCADTYGNEETSETNENITYTLQNMNFPSLAIDTDMPTTDGRVYAVLNDGTSTFIGGSFEEVIQPAGEGTNGAVINKDTGALETPFPKVSGTIYASTPDGDGGWYIGGDFEGVGATDAAYLAHINADGSVDTDFNQDSLFGGVRTIVLSGDYLYVGGTFDEEDVSRLARVDKATGEPDASFDPNPFGTAVYDLVINGDDLYIVGDFTYVGGLARVGVAKLDVETGEVDESFDAGMDEEYWYDVRTLSYSENDSSLYIGGKFYIQGTTYSLAKLSSEDGEMDIGFETELSSNTGSPYVHDTTIIGSYIYIGGGFSTVDGEEIAEFARLDKESGEVDVSCDLNVYTYAEPSTVYSVTTVGSDIYIGGDFDSVMGNTNFKELAKISVGESGCTLDEDFSVGLSKVVESPVYVYTISNYGEDLYIGGDFDNAGASARYGLAKINNSTGWVDTTFNPALEGSVKAIVLNGDYIYVGGDFEAYTEEEETMYNCAKIDKVTGVVDGDFMCETNGSVVDLLVIDDALYMVGEFSEVNEEEIDGVAKVDINSGELDESFEVDMEFEEVSAITTDDSGEWLYIGGYFTVEGQQDYLAKVDADTGELDETFNPVINESVKEIALSDEYLYIGGAFSTVDGEEIAEFARLDISTGEVDTSCDLDVYTEIPDTVYAIEISGSTVYVGGDFTHVSGSGDYSGLFRMDAESCTLDPIWKPQPENNDNYPYVYAIDVSSDSFWVGGYFDEMAGESVDNLAYFSLTEDETEAPSGTISINSGASYTKLTSVTLSLSGMDNETEEGDLLIKISNQSDLSDADWEDFVSSMSWSLTDGGGEKTVYFRLKDFEGNQSEIYSDSITLDTSKPGDLKIGFSKKKLYDVGKKIFRFKSPDRKVKLYFDVSDNGSEVEYIKFAQNKEFKNAEWRQYKNSFTFKFKHDGKKNVYFKFKDSAGNESKTYKQTLEFDTVKPVLTINNVTNALYSGSNLTLSGKSEKGVDIRLYVSGMLKGQLSNISEDNWLLNVVGLTGGNYSAVVEAEDDFGNKNTVNFALVIY